ncbi:hypothetical protein FHW16_003770 [Phyllobacterium myrsinacearum]|uniref:Uncharacterized protein n=1 Tax=Phyllobacterium myrsinacearum TaxID=28101 RepID=A0A839EJ91_9HYPH|nr:hypothetical protein [Phyllobacterium myrsinacearum]
MAEDGFAYNNVDHAANGSCSRSGSVAFLSSGPLFNTRPFTRFGFITG